MILDLHTHSIKSDDGRAKVQNYCQWIRTRELPIDGFVLTEHRQFDDESDYSVEGEVWVVSLDRDQAIQRAGSRDGTHKAAVQKRINAQMGNEERAERAHVIIDNSGDVADLLTQLDIQWQRIVRMMPQEAS